MFYSRIGKFNGKCLVVVVVGLNGQVLTKIVPCLLRSRLASLCFRSLVMDLERERSKSKISFPQGTETSLRRALVRLWSQVQSSVCSQSLRTLHLIKSRQDGLVPLHLSGVVQ